MTVVAVENGEVVGFVQVLTDGEMQSYVCQIVVASEASGRGIGRRLVDEAFNRSGAKRVDLFSLDESESFYRSFPHRRMPGYRLYTDL